MPAPEVASNLKFEIGHVLFIDIVGYSKLLINEQSEQIQRLKEIVRGTEQVRLAEAEGKLLRLPTGDGAALVFRTTPEAPVLCALEISKALKNHPGLGVRMGVHSGPVNEITDLGAQANIAGAGINIAQRVMDCGDAGHILLSKRVADDIESYPQWSSYLHDLGECEVKHGLRLHLFNLYKLDKEAFGNSEPPQKLRGAKSKTKPGFSPLVYLIPIVALLIPAIVFAPKLFREHKDDPAVSEISAPAKSIAVLPFDSLSDDKQDAYFADGIQDDILTALTAVADLKVISRSSVMKYRGATKDLRQIGHVLEVAHVLEGSVRRAGGRVRVNAQLIDTRDDSHLWAEQYDRELADVFAIQSEIAEKIVSGLKANLSGSEKAAIEVRPTSDLEAYDLYLRGKSLVDGLYTAKDIRGDIAKALELLSEAVKRDPGFALAYTLIARIHLDLYWFWGYAAEDLAQAGTAAQTALRLAPNLGEAHIEQGNYYYRQRNYEAALREFSIAEKLLPSSDVVPDFKAVITRRQGNWSEAIKSSRRSIELNPAQKNAYVNLADTFVNLRNYAEAERVIDQALRKMPETGDFFRVRKADIALAQGDLKRSRALVASVSNAATAKYFLPTLTFFERNYAEALRLYTILLDEEKFTDFALTTAFLLREQGNAARAQAILLSERERLQNEKVGPSGEPVLLADKARVDAQLGRKEEALRENQAAVDMLPLERDAVYGATIAFRQAEVLLAVGEKERAIKLLSKLATIPSEELGYGELLLNPRWDGLRGDPRFDQIVASLKPENNP